MKPQLVASYNRVQNPRWIGYNYQLKTAVQSEKINNLPTDSNRKSPVQHERRGHWRSQRVGAGRWRSLCVARSAYQNYLD